jgi:hypothetical protein
VVSQVVFVVGRSFLGHLFQIFACIFKNNFNGTHIEDQELINDINISSKSAAEGCGSKEE